MKRYLTGLILDNCGPYRGKHDIPLNRINAVVGESGSGKSFLRDCIEWCITGSCPRFTNGAGTWLPGIRLNGDYSQPAVVTLTFGGDTTFRIMRRVTALGTASVTLEDYEPTTKAWMNAVKSKASGAVQREIYRRTVSDRAWRVLLDAGRFATLSAAERSAVLQEVCSPKVSLDSLKEAVGRLTPAHYAEWEKLQKPLDWDFSLNRLTENRRVANARVKTLETALGAVKAVKPVDTTTPLAELQARLAELETEHDELLRQQGTAQAREKRRATLEKRRAELLPGPKLADLTEAVDAATEALRKATVAASGRRDKPLCPVTSEPCDQIDTVQKAVTEAQTAFSTAEKALADRTRQTKELNDIAAELTEMDTPNEEGRDAATVKAELDGLRKQLSDREAFEQAEGNTKSLTGQLEKARVSAQVLDDLVKAYGPTGLRKELAGDGTEFRDAVAQGVSELLDANPNLDDGMLVTNNGTVPLALLSHGEAERVGAAIQIGVGIQTGFWFIVLDEFGGALGYGDSRKLMGGILSVFRSVDAGCALLLGQIPTTVAQARTELAKLKAEGKPTGWNDEQFKAQLKRLEERGDLARLYTAPEIGVFEVSRNSRGSKVTKAK